MGAFALVIAVTGLAAGLVAALVGPDAFHRHMVAAGLGGDSAALAHAEAAFRAASGTALFVGLLVAALAALALSIAIARRAGALAAELTRASGRIAGGDFGARVGEPRLGAEFDGLAASFNDMAVGLAASQELKDRLLGDVAHELRTPVATIMAYLEAVEDGVVALAPETVAVLRSQGERLTRLASDLAAVSRAEDPFEQLELEEVEAAELLEQAASAARAAFTAKGVELKVVADAVPPAPVDRARLAQVLANLLDNALRHTPPGGQVRLSASLAPGAGGASPAVRFEVADTGDGIGAEHLGHVFERFYRADRARDRASGGSGIGLAIVKALVEAHGGEVSAASPGPGQGAVFTLTLPLS
jgi:signal transduction histidine kinase